MAEFEVTSKFTMRNDTAANWTTKNPVLRNGEFGYDTTNKRVKMGDGVTRWGSLPYLATNTYVDTADNAVKTYVNNQITLAINDSWAQAY